MRILNLIGLVLTVVGSAPLAAQGPLPPKADVADVPTVAAPSEATSSRSKPLNAEDAEAWLDGFIPYALERGQIPGAVVVVVKDGEQIVQKGYGYADLAAGRPVDPQRTLFRPGSVSKLFTWTAVMQQVEAGKLDLDQDVNRYLDFEIPPRDGKPITLRHIMTHTAGFEESVRYLISRDPDALMPLAEYARIALPERVFAPGTTPAYSNYATALAARIVERVSGMSFDDYVADKIFAPLDMQSSTFRQPLPGRLRDQMSKGYMAIGQDPSPFEIVIPAPAGSLSASGADMGRFMIAHLQNGGPLLEPSTAAQMHNYRAPNIAPLNTMALGFYEQRLGNTRAIAHGGDTEAFHSYLWLFPEYDTGLYISMNSPGKAGAAQAIRAALGHRFAERYFPSTRDDQPVDPQIAAEHARMLAGSYTMSRGAFTNFLSLLQLLGPNEVVVDADGRIALPSLDNLSAGARDWVEIEPFVWRDTVTGERVAAQVEDGRVIRFSIDTISPFTVLYRTPTGADPAWLIPSLIAALAIVVLAALAWPVRAIVRRRFAADFALSGRSLLAYRLSRAFSWLVLLAVAGWAAMIIVFSSDIGAIGGPLDWLIQLLRTLTPLASVGLLVTSAWHLLGTIRDGRRWTMRLGAVLLVLAALILTWITFRFHLYGYGLVY